MRSRMPSPDAAESAYPAAFAALADLLLDRAALHVQGVEHRFVEIEFYYRGRAHLDEFTHGDPMQRRFGGWYFHRTGSGYRGGTYKGLDLAFGDDDAAGGILVRAIERTEDAALVEGPCRVVDHVLALTGAPSIVDLVARFDLSIEPPGRGPSPLCVTHRETGRGRTVYDSPRVGLTLKRANTLERHRFIARPYRFLTEPGRIEKGKPHLAVALHRKGIPAPRIAEITATRPSVVQGHVDAYEAGRSRAPSSFGGDLSTDETCALFGACAKLLDG